MASGDGTSEGGAGAPTDSRALDAAMEAYANGDDEALRVVYQGVAPRLRAYLRRMLREDRAVEDLLHDSVLKMINARGSFPRGGKVLAWAFTIAHNRCLDVLAQERRALQVADAADYCEAARIAFAPDRDHDAKEVARAVEAALQQMPRDWSEAFRLIRLGGLTQQEAAAAARTSINAINMRFHKACLRLREVLRTLGLDIE